MKIFFTCFITCLVVVSATAQDVNVTTTPNNTSKAELTKEPSAVLVTEQAAKAGKIKAVKRTDKVYKRPVVEMTDEYIDNQIAEIQKVIDKNEGNKEFNLSGYQKRIKYLKSLRTKKQPTPNK